LKLHVDEALLAGFGGPIPRHVAIIMDGNGRWAEQRGLARIQGHHEGAQAVRRIVEACRYLEVEYLTLYAFSSENWKRPLEEVSGLMALFDLYLRKERRLLLDNQIRFHVIGDREKLPENVREAIEKLEQESTPGAKMTLQVAVSYGGRDEIVAAARTLAARVLSGELRPDGIDEQTLAAELYTGGQPDPDLVIRTSGEFRVSNFLLWQIAYSEFYITETLWPDFSERELLEAFESFGNRERRYGRTSRQLE
jgi:undecaprenyl diphosphate synthase